ncbi:MAG: DUF5662 family protein [Candidatus Cloacimonetes bacterium]|nr:DUF5662 family protein [Candidatus Cloacimonadota bacterium]
MKKPIDCVATRTAKAARISVDEFLERDFDEQLDEILEDIEPEHDQWTSMVNLFYQRTNNHVALVNKYAEIIYYRFPDVCAELVANARLHDASKYKGPEYVPYVYLTWGKQNKMDFTQICESMPECKIHGFKSPQDINDAINRATMHHVTTNKHHPECHSPNPSLNANNRDAAPDRIVIATDMDVLSLAEMCADWAAMSEELGTDLVKWAYDNVGIRWRFNAMQKQRIAAFLTICLQNGR